MDGRYVIHGVFAEGAQARLYSAQDLISSQDCILKAGQTAKEEALLALEFNHPYVVQPFDCGIHPETGTYAAYPKIDAPFLLEWIRTRPSDDELRRVAVQISEFVCFLHHRGYLYNDFKPEHFLISDQEIRVVDLGLCAPVRERALVFSGTFPYISPERLMGRRHDQRSDVFAFGILLLHCFYPKEEWNLDPSLPALQELLNKCAGLDDFWANLISQMTSLEPSQRFESAEEVWRRLLPSSASGNFLYFPLAVHRNGSNGDLFGEAHTLLVKSPSRIDLDGYENYALYSAWKQDWQTFHFDLQTRPLEDYFAELHKALLGEAPTDFFSCIQKLQTIKTDRKILILFYLHDRLSAQARSQAAFAVSSLSNLD
ncbi:MAG TPA: protein kinase, partial [Acidobacteriota bacterium]|nr:protein kinase [Acidobacteriota bacterium]